MELPGCRGPAGWTAARGPGGHRGHDIDGEVHFTPPAGNFGHLGLQVVEHLLKCFRRTGQFPQLDFRLGGRVFLRN